ncbi:hypothetical protein CQW23_06862 [Capsicum baccatum]|uniref:Lipocalin/cytosolic fatty-acid binding domain-containing protein n=1 Tax=Capsicum baccatum TaxID=33114 RepID=A0A2G2X4L5_CAPBA|nr:hypothetical protein CQW23_06862 [Capsicum baccatum]
MASWPSFRTPQLVPRDSWANLILCRRPHLDDEIYNQLVEKGKAEGYDVSKLCKTPQSDSPPSEDGPKDDKGIWWIKSILGK